MSQAAPIDAASISVAHCDHHGNVFVRLHDPDGKIFAVACMPAITAGKLALEITDNAEAARLAGRPDREARH